VVERESRLFHGAVNPSDLLYLAITVAFFAATYVLVKGLDRL
jgi:hypothetical protein